VSRTSIQVALGRHISHLRDGCAHHRRPPALRRPPRFLPRRAGARTRRARKGHNHHADSSPYPAHYRTPQGNPTFGEILWEVTDLAGGAVVMLLPLLLLAVPGIVLFVVLPALVLLAVATALAVVAGAIFAPICSPGQSGDCWARATTRASTTGAPRTPRSRGEPGCRPRFRANADSSQEPRGTRRRSAHGGHPLRPRRSVPTRTVDALRPDGSSPLVETCVRNRAGFYLVMQVSRQASRGQEHDHELNGVRPRSAGS
jgi:hypothetical protein